MADQRIGVGFVGAGGIARSRHVPGFRAIPGVELVGVVNRTPESSRRAADEFGFARTYTHWQELLEDPDIDAVVVATWPYLHAAVSIAALESGRHVLTEARMAMDAAEAQAMLDASLEHPDLVAMIVPSPFTLWVDATLRRLLAERAIGTLRTVRLTWSGGVSPAADWWRRQRRWSGNNTLALGIVYEAMARWLGHATAVSARTATYEPLVPTDAGPRHADVADYVAALVEFPAGVNAVIEMSATARLAGPNQILFFGSDGTLRLDLAAQRLEMGRAADEALSPVEIPASERADWRVEAEFVDAIRGGGDVRLTDFWTGVRYMAFTDAALESARGGMRITI
ncbi:MAG: Gfo/Idh/MocA family oxidoreductase [Chloroflexi bacterium]|nr:Gfo/Idh/MocA family oxidoreductase [Chloroflexota bacterium]